MDFRHFLFHHLGVSADQYNRGALLVAECKKCFSCYSDKKCEKKISDKKTFVEKRPTKMILETVLCSGNQPCFQIPDAQNIRQVNDSFSSIITAQSCRFTIHFSNVKLIIWFQKTFLHSAASNAPQLHWSTETPRWQKTKWWESMELENDKFCGNYPSR